MKRILIIEDDQIVAQIYRQKLTDEGYLVEVAADGEAALEAVPAFRPDLVLLDLMLPKVSGLEVLQRLRGAPETRATPVVVFSNAYLSSMVKAAVKAGATKCVTKSNCTPRQLVDILRSLDEDSNAATTAIAAMGPVSDSGNTSYLSQEEIRRRFSLSLPDVLRSITPLQKALATDGPVRSEHLEQVRCRIHGVANGAGVAGFARVGQVALALEALLKELQDQPSSINHSTLRTIAAALDFMPTLLAPGELWEKEIPPAANILAVDDDAISRRAVAVALERAGLNCIVTGDGEVALGLLRENRFDLVFLDIDMPAMNGLELCEKLRKIPAHEKTPVVFVTALTDFDSRAGSLLSGGTDLIGKPFHFMELALKALCYSMKTRASRMETAKPARPACPASA